MVLVNTSKAGFTFPKFEEAKDGGGGIERDVCARLTLKFSLRWST